MNRPPHVHPIVSATGQFTAITVRRATIGAWVCGKGAWAASKFLLLSHLGNRLLIVTLTFSLAWVAEHPRTAVQIQHDVVQDVARVSAPPAQADGVQNTVSGGQNTVSATLQHRLTHQLAPIGTIGHLLAPRYPIVSARSATHPCRPPTTLIPAPGPCGDRYRTMKQSNDTGSILAPPSTSVQAIWRALWAMGSPLADNDLRFQTDQGTKTPAEYIYDSGLATGVDPAVVVGFCYVESHCGRLGLAAITHSLGNERPSANLQPVIATGDGFYAYHATWFAGIDAIYRLLLSYAHHGLMTVSAAVPVWAPPSDNNTPDAYTAGVLGEMQRLEQ